MDIDTAMYSVKGIAILDVDGQRVLAKYYDDTFSSVKEQKAFEKKLFQKTHKANGEIILLDGLISVYRSNVDLFFYVLGGTQENELILVNVLNCLFDSISTILRKQVEKKVFIDNMDVAMLALDEMCDQGVVMETDPNLVVSRAMLKAEDLAFADQTVGTIGKQLFQSAKDQVRWSLMK